MNKIGALWLKTSKKGTKFMSGKIGEQRVVVFKVKEKKSEKHPDYEIFESEPMPQQSQEQQREEEPWA